MMMPKWSKPAYWSCHLNLGTPMIKSFTVAASSYSAEVLNHLCDNDDYDKQYAAFEVLQDWSTAYALRSVLGIDTESSNQKLRSMSPRQQQDWALTTYEQLSRCEVPQLPKGSK